MALPGLLIEYLISGSVALLWLIPLTSLYGHELPDGVAAAFVVAGLYVVGMAIDFCAFWLVKPLKRLVRNRAWIRYAQPAQPSYESSVACHVRFALYSPELAKEVAMRASRDRIARGAMVNILVIGLCAYLQISSISITLLLALFLIATAMWVAFEYTSYGYELRADYELQQKRRKAEPPPAV